MNYKILSFPDNHDYCKMFKSEMEKRGNLVKLMPSFHHSTPLNIIRMVVYRLKGYNIIHIHWVFFANIYILNFFILFSKILRYDLYWEVHNVIRHRKDKILKNEIRARNILLENIRGAILHNEKSKSEIENRLNYKVTNYVIAPHGNFIDYYPNEISKKEAKKRLGLLGKNKIVLLFGSISINRGYKQALDFILNSKESRYYNFIIVGKLVDKELKEYLDDLKNYENVFLYLNHVDSDRIQYFFNASDICLLPYIETTTSGVGILSGSFGIPISATIVGDINEYLIDKKTGVIIEENTSEGIGKSLKKIFNMDTGELGENLNNLIKKKYNWDDIVNNLRKIYSS
jgi:beta-1,4-mannosyltransferase